MKKRIGLDFVRRVLGEDIVDIKEAQGLYILTRRDGLLRFYSKNLEKCTGWYRGDYEEKSFGFVLRRDDGAIRLCSGSDVGNKTDFFFGKYRKNRNKTISYWEIEPEKTFAP